MAKFLDSVGLTKLWQKILKLTIGTRISEWVSYEQAVEDLKDTPIGTVKQYVLRTDIDGNSNLGNKGYGVLSADIAQKLLMGDLANPKDIGYSVGDILSVTHYYDGEDDNGNSVPILIGTILPTQDAKSKKGNFPGANGLETSYDKLQIEQIMQLNIEAGPNIGSYNADECLEPGIYMEMTSGRSMKPNDSDEHYILIVTPRKTFDNGWQNGMQIAISLKHNNKRHYRFITWNPEKVFQNFSEWHNTEYTYEYVLYITESEFDLINLFFKGQEITDSIINLDIKNINISSNTYIYLERKGGVPAFDLIINNVNYLNEMYRASGFILNEDGKVFPMVCNIINSKLHIIPLCISGAIEDNVLNNILV